MALELDDAPFDAHDDDEVAIDDRLDQLEGPGTALEPPVDLLLTWREFTGSHSGSAKGSDDRHPVILSKASRRLGWDTVDPTIPLAVHQLDEKLDVLGSDGHHPMVRGSSGHIGCSAVIIGLERGR